MGSYPKIIKIFTVSSEDDDYPPNWRHLAGMPNVIYAGAAVKLLAGMIKPRQHSSGRIRETSRYSMFATDSFCCELSPEGNSDSVGNGSPE